MTAIIIIVIIIFFIIYTVTKKKQPVQQRTKVTNFNVSQKTEQDIKNEIDQNILNSLKKENSVNQKSINPKVIIENKNIEPAEIIQYPILNSNNFESEMSNGFDIKAYIIEKFTKKVGEITELSVNITKSGVKLFLDIQDWEKKSLDCLLIEFEVDKDSNFIIVNSSNEDISPLKQGDLFTFYFEDGSFIEKKFGVGRIHTGKNIRNIVCLTDIELAKLGRNTLSHIETFSGLKIRYEFSDIIINKQNLNNLKVKKLFKIISETINEVNLILINSNESISLSLKYFFAFTSNNVIKTNNIESEIEIKNIFDTEASIVKELSNEVGKITRLAGEIGNGEIKFYLALNDWKKFTIDFLPTLSIEIKIDKNSNFIVVNSSNKVISSLKKGDLFSIYFEDGSFIEKKFEVGRIQSGKNVINIIHLNDLELEILSQNTLSHIETFSGLKIPYEFTEKENKQYASSTEGKKLFQIICEKIVGLKSILSNSNKNFNSSQKTVVAPLISSIERERLIVSTTTKELPKIEIVKILQSLLIHKNSNAINSLSKVKIDNSIIEVTDQTFGINSSDNLPIFQNSVNPIEQNEEYSDSSINDHTKSDASEIQHPLLLNEPSEDSIQLDSEIKEDVSIIDVTDQSYRINSNNNLKKYDSGVPYWAHHYVYSYSELNSASDDQKKFYNIFKINFLNGDCFDLEGNTNDAFILLFDLQNEYENHKDIAKLESQLKILGKYYPKTKSYGVSFLIQKMRLVGDNESISRFQNENSYHSSYNSNSIDYDTFSWRSKYKTKLDLNKENENLLDRIWYPSNNFCSIEFCCLEVIKLYIAVISELKNKYKSDGTTIVKEFTFVADVIARKHFKYRIGSQNYKYSIESTTNEFYSNIFKHCENAVRQLYGHKRKLNTDTYYTNEEAKSQFESKIISKVSELLPQLISKVAKLDEATELELNSQTTSRWKVQFEELTANFKNDPISFVEAIIELGKLNKNNPSIENIFFEASKFIAKYDKVTSLTLYVHYLFHDLKSATFDNKQLTKTIQKSLFKTNEQLHDFEQIVSELIKDKKLDKALNSVTKIFEVKRKKIQLDRTTIKEVQKQHSGTVELLNEYLRDDFEDENYSIQSQELNSEEIKIEIIQKNEESQHSAFLSTLALNPIHFSFLELFSKNNFSILQSEIEEFAKSKGVFKNQVIESINETCYEVLDDVLIEEEDDYYTIIPEYFQKISAK